MRKAPIPSDDRARIASVRQLDLESGEPDERFDRVTRIARKTFDVPIALISVVDTDHQWAKSSQGIEPIVIPRALSFCGHTILGDDVMVIADAKSDERFADNPLVTGEPRIRFYAGCPLVAPDGHRVGALCVLDNEPRTFSPEDLAVLRDLGQVVQDEFAAARLSDEREQLTADLADARRKAATDSLTQLWNREMIFGILGAEWSRSRRSKRPLAVAMVDLDRFKRINDEHGHPIGDAVIAETSHRVQGAVRPYDAVGRYGGEEFMVVLSDCNAASAARVAERIRSRIEASVVSTEAGGLPVTCSVGAASTEVSDADCVEELVKAADRALYDAKNAGRNTVVVAGK